MGVVLAETALAAQVADRQAAGQRAVFTNGVFDLLHIGHTRYLQRARSLGDFLIVGVNSDASTRRLKGPARPLVPEVERAELLAALACVEYVTVFGDATAERLVGALRPAIYAKGGDLVVVAPVSAGAELIADGHIHVYGVLRGRAIAGATGDTNARIFAHRLEAELVCVAGRYFVSEAIAPEYHKRAAQVALIDDQLRILPGWG